MELRFKSKRKNCRIQEQDSESEGVLGGIAASSSHNVEMRTLKEGTLKRCMEKTSAIPTAIQKN